jgi:hypothetical protein
VVRSGGVQTPFAVLVNANPSELNFWRDDYFNPACQLAQVILGLPHVTLVESPVAVWAGAGTLGCRQAASALSLADVPEQDLTPEAAVYQHQLRRLANLGTNRVRRCARRHYGADERVAWRRAC